MKIKTLFIAPYSAMIPLIKECKEEENELDIKVKMGNLGSAIPFVREAEAVGVEMIISRGGTAKLIAENTKIPVIDVHVSGYDMLRVLTLGNEFPGKKAIVGFSNITLGAKAITDLLDIQIEVFTVEHESQVQGLVYELKEQGFELIMGDVVTTEVAIGLGLQGILIQSGREAIFDAFQRVKSVFSMVQQKQQENKYLKAILSTNANNCIIKNKEGKTVFEQWEIPTPTSKTLTEAISKLQSIESPFSIILSDEESAKKLKVQYKTIPVDDDEYLHQYSFIELVSDTTNKIFMSPEAVTQVPLLVHTSQNMKVCLESISVGLTSNFWMLIGEEGTGKRLLAKYIHHIKHKGNGLFVTLSATDFINVQNNFDEDIQTIYITCFEELPSNEQKLFIMQCNAWIQSGKDLIISLDEEDTSLYSVMFEEKTNRIYVPPLRQRTEDIKPLTAYFIAYFHQQYGSSAVRIKEEAVELLENYPWPGNVAELKAILYDAVQIEKGYTIDKNVIEMLLSNKKSNKKSSIEERFLNGTLEDIEKRIIEVIMEEEGHNQTKVARRLGINRSTLWRKLKQ